MRRLHAVASLVLGRERTLRACESLAAVTELVSSVEYLVSTRARTSGGLYPDGLVGVSIASPRLRRIVQAAARPAVSRAWHVGRILAAAALLAPTSARTRLAANAYLTASTLILEPSQRNGMDGADMASFVVQSASTVARAAGGRTQIVDAALWYLASQSVLSYSVAGMAKTVGPAWRTGAALSKVMRTINYGDRQVWRFLVRHPGLARLGGWAVLAMECGFPVVLVGPGRRMAPALVGVAAVFHLANARIMGLNRFLPAFAALHPALLYVTGPRTRTGPDGVPEHRDDLLPAVVGATGIALALVLAVDARRRRAIVAQGSEGERAMRMSSGNLLRYRPMGLGGSASPLVVLVAGLGGSAVHWEWVSRRLGRRHRVLVYDRAGYGGSTHAGGHTFDLEAAVDDLVELVTAKARDRPVVLVGYSLGGYLAWLGAQRMPNRVAAVVLVDSSHPDEFTAGSDCAGMVQRRSAALSHTVRWLRMGLGAFLTTPNWAANLPAEVRGLAEAQFRSTGTWVAARREWRALCEHVARRPVGPPAVPTLAITARKTVEDRPIAAAAHAAAASAAPGGQFHVVDDCDHTTIVHAQWAARQVARLIDDFVAGLAGPSHPRPTQEAGGTNV